MGIPEFEAKKNEGKVKSGSCLISVHSDDSNETKRSKEIFEHAGARISVPRARPECQAMPMSEVRNCRKLLKQHP